MPRKLYTILILPRADSRMKKIHLSRNFVLSMAGLLAALLLAGASAPHLLLRMTTQDGAMERLAEENQAFREEKLQFENSLMAMRERLEKNEQYAGKLAEALGVDGLPASAPAAGGARAIRPSMLNLQRALDDDMNTLEDRAANLDQSMGMIDNAWNERLQLLAATPNIRPVRGFFSHGYGWRKDPFTGEREFHQGVDIVANKGTPIRATADGVITRATRYMGYGKMVRYLPQLRHGYPVRPHERDPGPSRPEGEAGRRHRQGRLHRPVHRSAPALRGVPVRPPGRSLEVPGRQELLVRSDSGVVP